MDDSEFLSLASQDFEAAFKYYLGDDEYEAIKDTGMYEIRRHELLCLCDYLLKNEDRRRKARSPIDILIDKACKGTQS